MPHETRRTPSPRARRRVRRRFRASLAAAACCGAAWAGEGLAADGSGAGGEWTAEGLRTAVTNSPAFALPAGELGDRGGLAAVRLFRSVDGGASWAPAGTFPPDAVRLPHEVPRDGRYLFGVRGLDRRGGLHPAGGLAPEYAVVVDTAGPALTLKGWWTGEDRVRVTLTCEDEHLVRDRVRLRWLSADPAAGWVDLTPAPDEATSRDGLVKIDLTRPLATPFDVAVRASATDAAGNRSEATLPLPRPAAVSSTTAAATLRFADPAPPGFGPAVAPPRRLPAAANRATEANRAVFTAPAAGGFPVAAFPAAGVQEDVNPAAPAFPVARFRLPAAAAVAPGPAPHEPAALEPAAPPAIVPAPPADAWADPLNTGWGTDAQIPAAAAPPAPPPRARFAPADGGGPVEPPRPLFGAAETLGPVAASSAGPAGVAAADALYERLVAAAPRDRALRLAYADRLLAAGRRADAARHLRTLLRADPADREALRRLADCLPPVGP